MAYPGVFDSSYSPSDSKTELIDHASTSPSSRLSSPISSAGSSVSWHPKLTLYRLLVILSSVGLGAAKTVTSYLNLTFTSITLEWILGVVVFLFFELLGVYEETSSRSFTWLFNFDYMDYLWTFLENLTSFKRPYYISDEIDTRYQTIGIDPLVTGYRIIVTVVVASVGMTKSALVYGQEPMEATTLECVFGVGIATGLYFLGLYETSSTKVYPNLFHVDYSGGLTYTITTAAIVFLQLFLFALSYGFYLLTTTFLSSDMLTAREPSLREIIEVIVMWFVVGGTTSLVSLAFATGAVAFLCFLGWLDCCASSLGQFIARLPGVGLIPYLRRKYWLPSRVPLRHRPRSFYLKRFRQIVQFRGPLCGIIWVLMMCIAASLLMCWPFIHSTEEGNWYSGSSGLFLFLFSVIAIPFTLALGACMTFVGYITIEKYFTEAWERFTVGVESPEAPFEGV